METLRIQKKTDRNVKNSVSTHTLLAIFLIVLCVFLIYNIYKHYKIKGEDKNQRLTHYYYNNIAGDTKTEEAENVILYGNAIENPRAIDHYRIGAVQLLNIRDIPEAHAQFTLALNNIIENKITDDTPFILDRIAEFQNLFVDFEDAELPLQIALEHYYANRINKIAEIKREKPEIQADDPEFVQKTILAQQHYQSDSQNVHDSVIYRQMNDQYQQIVRENTSIPNYNLHDYTEAVNWIKIKYRDNPKLLGYAEKTFQEINRNSPVYYLNGTNEQDVLTAVWRRTFDSRNSNVAESMRDALADAVVDCVEHDSVVCITGRPEKIWQSLATLDCNPVNGIFKSKQILRNEIYTKCAKIVNDVIGDDGTASKELKEAYKKDENTEQVRELKESIRNKMDEICNDYKNLINPQECQLIIDECKAVVG